MTRWNADDYAKNSAQQQSWARELISKLGLRGDERVLDIGCGDGKVTAELAAQVPRGSVVGLDSSSQMIEFARSAFAPSIYPNLSFVVGDAADLHFEHQFDVVFSNAALHWIYDHRPVLAGISRALRPDGRILLQMGGQGNASEILAVVESVARETEWKSYFENFGFRYGFHGPVEYARWLREAGMHPQRVQLVPKDMVHAGADRLAGWFRTTWMPYTQVIPTQHRDKFIAEVIARYVQSHPPDSAGQVHVKMVRLEVEAHAEKSPASCSAV
jgi:trans-aconitate methyltransferase